MAPVLLSEDAVLTAREKPLGTDVTSKFFPPPKHSDQTDSSYKEQTKLMEHFRSLIDQYLAASTKHRNFVIVSGPGVGKTTVAMICTLYCLSIGMNGITTSIVSNCSKELGGIHFHQLICLQGNFESSSPGQMAGSALCVLYRNPEALEFIKSLDFINLDEVGPFSTKNLAILDMIMPYVKGSSQFMGGIFMFCTMDHLQLLPFRGTSVFLSMYIIIEFSFFKLSESVRAANNPPKFTTDHQPDTSLRMDCN
jgi:hypothetical protein